MGEYLFPIEKVTSYFKSINSKEDLQKFIQQRSAHVTQNTLYGYLKTRMGHKFTLMVDDEAFSNSINLANNIFGRFFIKSPLNISHPLFLRIHVLHRFFLVYLQSKTKLSQRQEVNLAQSCNMPVDSQEKTSCLVLNQT